MACDWRKKRELKRQQQNIPDMIVDLNNPPNYNKLKQLMLKYNDETMAIEKANDLFTRRSNDFIERYITIIDKTNEIHLKLLFSYAFYFICQYDIMISLENILNKYFLSFDKLLYLYLFD